ncbi:DUF732 domain-containing protein [Mycobacterium kiyosense]|uniref:DUF732 domain-containing protein n=1 Tax=Mycobacterium kiyosense TaxID=2871094 RepID=UPI0022325304|nr:DUF732 domain-containing protein [Mycobacterium kiyosense]
MSISVHAVLMAPEAAANCSLSADEAAFVALLSERGISPAPGATGCDLAMGGHVVAYDIRHGVSPAAEARKVYLNTNLSTEQSMWFVATAVVVFAPEMVPSQTSTVPIT